MNIRRLPWIIGLGLLLVFVTLKLKADVVELKGGNTFSGTITKEDKKSVTIKTDCGEITIEKSRVKSIKHDKSSETVTPPESSVSSGTIPQGPLPDLVARVGQGGITKKEFEFYLLKRANHLNSTVEELAPEERKNALDTAIEDELIFQGALADGMLENEYIRWVIIEQYRTANTTARIDPESFSDEELKKYYDAHPAEFIEPPQVNMEFLEFPNDTPQEEMATARQQALNNPESAGSWKSGGWLKPNDQTVSMVPGLDTIFNLKKGEVSDILHDKYGRRYLIIRIKEKLDGRLKSFDESRERARFLLISPKKEALDTELQNGLNKDNPQQDDNERLFRAALKAGQHRELTTRLRIISEYLAKQGIYSDLKEAKQHENILTDLRRRFSVEIIPTQTVK